MRKHSLDSASSWHVMTPPTATSTSHNHEEELDKLKQRVHDLEIEVPTIPT